MDDKNYYWYTPVAIGILGFCLLLTFIIFVEEWTTRPTTEKPTPPNNDLGNRFVFINKDSRGICPTTYSNYNLTSCIKIKET